MLHPNPYHGVEDWTYSESRPANTITTQIHHLTSWSQLNGDIFGNPLTKLNDRLIVSFPVAQLVEHGASNAKIMGSIPRESKSW